MELEEGMQNGGKGESRRLGGLFSFAFIPQLCPLPLHTLLCDLGGDLNGLHHLSFCSLLSGGPGQ